MDEVNSTNPEKHRGVGWISNPGFRYIRKEFLGLDQAWRIKEHHHVSTYLAMESENTTKLDKQIDDEFEKLIDVKAKVKVLVYYPPRSRQTIDLQELQRKIESAESSEGERYIMIMIDSDASRRDGWKGFSRLSVDCYELCKGKTRESVGEPFEMKMRSGMS